MSPGPPPASQTKALILKRFDQKWLDSKVKLHKEKYKGAFPEGLMYWMIASQSKIAVDDIKAGSDGSEGEEVSLAALEDMLQDEDVLETWTHVVGGKFEQPKKQAKYCINSAAVVDMIPGETSTGKPKLDIIVSDGAGAAKVVAYAKAIDLLTEAKVKVGSVVRLPLLNGQYGHWTKKGGKNEPDEEVLWYKLSLPPFGSVYKLDTPVSSVLKNLDQVVVRPKDACYVDGFITNLDPSTRDTCSKCFRWYDDKKADEHRKCKGAEILEVTSYEGTIATTSGQIYKLVWSADARNGETTVKEPKIKVGDDTVRIFGTLTERSSLLVTGFKIIDPSEIQASEDSTDEDVEAPARSKNGAKRLPKASKPAPEPDDEVSDEDEEEEEPKPRQKPKFPAFAKIEPKDEDEEEDDEEDDEPVPPPRRRVPTGKVSAPVDEDDGEDEEDEEAPSPLPRRRVTAKAPSKAQDEPEEDEEDEDEADDDDEPAAPPTPRRRVKAAPAPEPDEDEEEDDLPAPKPVRKASKVVEEVEEDDEEDEKPIVKMTSKKPAKAKGGDKITEFILTALSNFGTPQRIVIIAKSAVKAGLVECDDPKDVESLKGAFAPHLEAAIESGAVKWADDKRQTVWIAKEA